MDTKGWQSLRARFTRAVCSETTQVDHVTEDEIDEDAEEGTLFVTTETGEVIRPTSGSSVKRVSTIIAKMTKQKMEIVESIGFGGLLKLPNLNKVDRGFTFWLLTKIDCHDRTIVGTGREEVTMEPADVYRILGIPMGGKPVCGLGTDDLEQKFHFIEHNIGAEEGEANSLKAARINVEKDYPDSMNNKEIAMFKVSFVVFVLGYFLAPTSKCNHGSSAFWGALTDPDDIANFNWCQYVLDMLVESAVKAQADLSTKKKCSNVTGCPLLLQVIFFDNINLVKMNLPYGLKPCVAGLTCDTMRKMIAAVNTTRNTVKPTRLSYQRFDARRTYSDGAIGGGGSKSSYSKPLSSIQKVNTPHKLLGSASLCYSKNTKHTPTLSSSGRMGYIPANPLADFIASAQYDGSSLCSSKLTALKWFNARMILHTNNLRTQIQQDTVQLMKKLLGNMQPDLSISNNTVQLTKRTTDDCQGDADTCSEASSSMRNRMNSTHE